MPRGSVVGVGMSPWRLRSFDELVEGLFQECPLEEAGESPTQKLPKRVGP